MYAMGKKSRAENLQALGYTTRARMSMGCRPYSIEIKVLCAALHRATSAARQKRHGIPPLLWGESSRKVCLAPTTLQRIGKGTNFRPTEAIRLIPNSLSCPTATTFRENSGDQEGGQSSKILTYSLRPSSIFSTIFCYPYLVCLTLQLNYFEKLICVKGSWGGTTLADEEPTSCHTHASPQDKKISRGQSSMPVFARAH